MRCLLPSQPPASSQVVDTLSTAKVLLYSTLLQVQHVAVLMEDTLYIPRNCYVGMSTACGHAYTRYEVYKIRAIYWHFQTRYLNFVVSSSPGILISSRRCIVYGSGTFIVSRRCIVYCSGTFISSCRCTVCCLITLISSRRCAVFCPVSLLPHLKS